VAAVGEPGDRGLQKFYDKVAPSLADGLGAKLEKGGGGYTLSFPSPNAKVYGNK
jgi:hypothetical protein